MVPVGACDVVVKEEMRTMWKDWAWLYAVQVVFLVGFALGVVARGWWHRFSRRPAAQKRTMRTQAMVTYRRELATPRFQLGPFDGAWED